MAATIKIMGVHGLGDHRGAPWRKEWQQAIEDSFPDSNVELAFDWISYDDIFAEVELTTSATIRALGKLIGSGFAEAFGAKKRGFLDQLDHTLRWYAGYVVAWVENEEFQKKTRARVLEKVGQFQPDLLLAHSLGSLVTYNALTHADAQQTDSLKAALAKLNYVTLGSQLGNPFVRRNLTPGRIELPRVKRWFHLYNPRDKVFTAAISLPRNKLEEQKEKLEEQREAFEQVDCTFDSPGFANHDAPSYLSRPAVIDRVYRPLDAAARGVATRAFHLAPDDARVERSPKRRALLVGINDYPDPAARLEGCVNDVFLMSSVLQECDFQPEQIRLCLNERATAQGIRERLEWLVSDAGPGDELVFFYSGHGAQLATYGDGDAIDHKDETLVPYDFDWTPEHSVIDDQIFDLYSQLPYETRLVLIFDCCHSGGIHRSGSRKGRGLEPPDDIRHRSMRWNKAEKMWEDRDLRPLTPDFADDPEVQRAYCGRRGDARRLGRAMSLRKLPHVAYRKLAAERDAPVGPYLPLILEACQEGELASEYRHGNESYGAFTYALVKTLRDQQQIRFDQLVQAATKTLQRLGYEQAPQILGPQKVMSAIVPWLGDAYRTDSAAQPKSKPKPKPAAAGQPPRKPAKKKPKK